MNIFKKLSIVGCALALVLVVVILITVVPYVGAGASADTTAIQRMADARKIESDFRYLDLVVAAEPENLDLVHNYMNQTSEDLDAYMRQYEDSPDEYFMGMFPLLGDLYAQKLEFETQYDPASQESAENLMGIYYEMAGVLSDMAEYDMAMLNEGSAQTGRSGFSIRLIAVPLFSLLITDLLYTIVMVVLIKPKKPRAKLPDGMVY